MANIQLFINSLLRFRKTIISFATVIGFFFIYNTFLIDHTLENLKFSLEQTALAYDVADLNGVDLLLNQVMVEEIIPKKIDVVKVANLEYARNALNQSKDYRVIDNVKVSLDNVIKEKERERGTFLMVLDRINDPIKKFVAGLVSRLTKPFKMQKLAPPAGITDIAMLEKAQVLEKQKIWKQALLIYQDFVKKFPTYEKAGFIKLRIANIHQRLGQGEKARSMYREVIRDYSGMREASFGQLLLFKLEEANVLMQKSDRLLTKLAELKKEDKVEAQIILYQLGAINMQLLNAEEAKKFFRRAAVVDPKSELGVKANFNYAWLNKEDNKMEESLAEFSKLAEENPKGAIALDSRYQVADIYHKQGQYQEAINIYLKLVEDHKDDPIAALCLFQAAASYMYDLSDDEKARELFGRLTKEYPNSPYARFLAPRNPIGVFVTFLVPRATRVVTWRAGGLLALSGYSGEILKFKVRAEEKAFNQALNDYLKVELPDTVGNLYVDIRGTELEFLKGKGTGKGRITMGRFTVDGNAEGHFELGKDGTISLILTKAILDRIPIPPFLINNSLTGISLVIRKHFPVFVNRIDQEKGEMSCEGYGSKRMLKRVKKSLRDLMGIDVDLDKIKDPKEEAEVYGMFKQRFPESDFSPHWKETPEAFFLDFLTREYLYLGFKLLETIKDSKLDYERSIRTLGRLAIKKGKFKVTYKEGDINTSLNKLIREEYPWIMDKEFLFDIKGVEFHFTDEGDIKFSCYLALGHVTFPIKYDDVTELKVEGRAIMDIDKESKIPRLIFKEITLNGKPFPVERANLVSLRCLNMLKDGHIPFQLDECKITNGTITMRGEGARDFTSRVFSDPHLFVIFQVRHYDLVVAGIQRLKEMPHGAGAAGDYWRGRGRSSIIAGSEKEYVSTSNIGQQGAYDTPIYRK